MGKRERTCEKNKAPFSTNMKTRFPDRGDYKAEYLSLVAENVQISPMVLATHLTVLYCGYKGSGQESLNRHIQF